LFGVDGARASDDLVLVTGADHGLSTVSPKEAKKYLTGQIAKWPDGETVVIVLLPAKDEVVVRACKELIRMQVATYRRFLTEKAFRGSMTVPLKVDTVDNAVALLAENPGGLLALPRGSAGSAQIIEIGGK
jgi:hypothetical protein